MREQTNSCQKIVYCDFDGTLIKQNIESRLVGYLIKSRRLLPYQYVLAIISIPANRITTKLGMASVFKSWSAFISREKYVKWIDDFLNDEWENITLSENILKMLEHFEKTCSIIILTGSEEYLVQKFLEKKHLNFKVIGSATAKRGFLVKRHPFGKEKCKFLDKNCYSIGIANEYADRYYLQKCNEQYIVRGDIRLETVARKMNWRVC